MVTIDQRVTRLERAMHRWQLLAGGALIAGVAILLGVANQAEERKPIGAVVSPMLTNLSDAKDLPYASSLCGACREVCPVKINIPRMLLYLRNQLVEGDKYPQHKNVSLAERLAMKGWRMTVSNSFILGLSNKVGRIMQKPFARNGKIGKLPRPFSAWTRHRTFPAVTKPFRDRWKG